MTVRELIQQIVDNTAGMDEEVELITPNGNYVVCDVIHSAGRLMIRSWDAF